MLKLWLTASFKTTNKLEVFIKSLSFGGDKISYRTSRTEFSIKPNASTIIYLVMLVLISFIYILSNAVN